MDKNKITSKEELVKTLEVIGRKLKKQYHLTQEENLFKVTRVD